MDNETLFYLCGGVLAVSAIVVTAVGLKSEKFPGRALPLVVVWFAIFVVGAATFAVRYSTEEREHKEHELALANEEIEAAEGDNTGDAADLGSEESAPEEGSQEEEPIGGAEGEPEGSEGGAGAATTLKLAADEAALAFDKTELDAKAGKLTIDFDNPSAIEHNVVIEADGKELAGFEPIVEGEEELSADLKPGTYTFFCSVPGHREAGMEGTLKVQ
ncbi:MAG TPA: plastocyanin/azurin family copper-binding protein [Solirubrobacterales bacterium]|nr:plastocyanin/azurin family copper-binding protein [Solirubrobacterales bacterium]